MYVMCDDRCWAPVLASLSTVERTIAHITLKPDPADHQVVWFCVACAGCGRVLLTPPGECVWHGSTCPTVDTRFTGRAVVAARQLILRSRMWPLPPLPGAILAQAAADRPDDSPAELTATLWKLAHVWVGRP